MPLHTARHERKPTVAVSFNVDVIPADGGKFLAQCRETGQQITSVNAEYDLARAVAVAGWPDGRVQYWRGKTPSLSHRSIHKMGSFRISLGEDFPAKVRRREFSSERPEAASLEALTVRGLVREARS